MTHSLPFRNSHSKEDRFSSQKGKMQGALYCNIRSVAEA